MQPPPPPRIVALRFALTPVRADGGTVMGHRAHVGTWRCPAATMTARDAAVAVRAQLATAFNDERAARGSLPGMIAMCGAPCDAWRGVAARFGVQLHVVSPPSLWARLMAVFWRHDDADDNVHLVRHPLAFVVACEACDDDEPRTVTSVEELVHRLAVLMHDRLVAASRPEPADEPQPEPMFARAARRMVVMTSSDSESSHSSDDAESNNSDGSADDTDESNSDGSTDDTNNDSEAGESSAAAAAPVCTSLPSVDYPEAAAAAPAAAVAPPITAL